MNRSTPGLSIYHQFLEFTQTHIYWVGDAIQPSHLLSSPSPPAFDLSQHQGLFQRVGSSHQVVKVLELQLQHQSFQWIFRTDLLYDGLVGSPCSPRGSQECSPTPQFKSINSSAFRFLYSPTLTLAYDSWKNHSCENTDPGQQSDVSAPLIPSALCGLGGIFWAASGSVVLLSQSRQMKGEISLGQSFCKC